MQTARTMRFALAPALFCSLAVSLFAADPDPNAIYTLGPDSQPQDNVPKGKLEKFTFTDSKIFPGTTREWQLYVPAQYKPEKPACLMVCFDGGGYANPTGGTRVPVVLDNLIAKKEVPVTIGVFINPGTFKATTPGAKDRSNRSFEYDSLGDATARFVLEEILPQVQKDYKLTDNPDGWSIAGASSGAIAAFTVAWEKPEKFHKVISWIGSFTNIRGGYVYPSLIRASKAQPKPIRVFLQDGANDLDNMHGNWPLANQDMAAALKFAGYDYKFELGTGTHSGKHGASILPDTLRWLWRDWPKE